LFAEVLLALDLFDWFLPDYFEWLSLTTIWSYDCSLSVAISSEIEFLWPPTSNPIEAAWDDLAVNSSYWGVKVLSNKPYFTM
jgi:hypothetical protein